MLLRRGPENPSFRICAWLTASFITGLLFLTPPGMTPGAALADDLANVQATHPWGRCRPGSWKRVKVVTESLDAKGRVTNTSTTDTLSFLEEITERDYALRVEVTVEVGEEIHLPTAVDSARILWEAPGQVVSRRKIRDEEISLQGRTMPVENREITIQTEKQRRVSTVHYSEKTQPHVLRSLTTITNGDGKTAMGSTQVDVVALDMPYRVLSETRNASFVRTVQMQPTGATTVTLEVHCSDVPGGVVAHMSKEIDEAGQTLKRSTLELLEYDHGHAEDSEITGRRVRFQHRSRGREATPNDRSRRR